VRIHAGVSGSYHRLFTSHHRIVCHMHISPQYSFHHYINFLSSERKHAWKERDRSPPPPWKAPQYRPLEKLSASLLTP